MREFDVSNPVKVGIIAGSVFVAIGMISFASGGYVLAVLALCLGFLFLIGMLALTVVQGVQYLAKLMQLSSTAKTTDRASKG